MAPTTNTEDLVDPYDFCRDCRGKGGAYDQTGRGTRIWVKCYSCRGTGNRTVRVDPARGDAA